MVDQASVSRGNGTNNHASPLGVVSNLADFGNDIATLVELQVKLAALDAQEATARATVPMALLGTGAVVGLGTIPVILMGLADLIASSTRLSAGSAQLIVGLVTLALAGLFVYFGVRGLTGSLESFRRSREELTRNLSWIRTVLVYSGRSAGRHRV
jgi:Putative Actinobacterial Holin-X, holin superfamily III